MRSVRFKVPTAFEWAHEFLWRIHKNVPATGERAVFNRSHTEDLLITKVHGLIDESEVQRRCQHINGFERMLVETCTTISKFFLHISKDGQQIRLQERLNVPNKHWKFDRQDQVERSSWDAYQAAYQATIPATHQDFAPWYIFPSNSKTQRYLIVAGIVAEKLVSMGLNYPSLHSDYFQITLD